VLKKAITYTNPLTGQEVTEEHFFHLSKADLIEMEVSEKGGMEAYLNQVIKSEDNGQILTAFKKIVRASYGRKVGDKFVKDEQYTSEFMASEAWSEFLMSLMQDATFAAQFVNAIMPNLANLEAKTAPESDPTGLTDTSTPRFLTQAEVVEMDSDELKSGLATGRYKLS
jgi:hypothetical protein